MSKNKPEVDCTSRCKSRRHGDIISGAITKRSISDRALASFIKGTCANFVKAFDNEGRTALHMAASRGRVPLMEWLIRHSSEAFINARDRESGYTPLHRSIYYGQINCAVSLLKIGVKTDIPDHADYKALEHALLDRRYMYKVAPTHPCDAYVWGTNCNYTLGTGSNQPKNSPDLLASFIGSNVKQVCLGKFHSIWLCASGSVSVSGQAGRAGAAGRATALRPTRLAVEGCVSVAITLDSTILLMDTGTVLQYTLNDAYTTPNDKTRNCIKLPSTKPLIKLSAPLGVRAGKLHGVVWNKRGVYTWGSNVGQLGHPDVDKIVPVPKRVSTLMNQQREDTRFELVDAGDAATVITTSRGDVFLLHKYICKRIAIKQTDLRQVCVEAKLNDQGVCPRVTVLLLNNVGQISVWHDDTNKLTKCVFTLAHQINVTHMALSNEVIFFTTNHGEAFKGTVLRKATPLIQQPIRKEREKDGKSALAKDLEKDDSISLSVVKIPNLHRAVSITVDSEGLNFVCLQTKPTCGVLSMPELSSSSMVEHMDALRLTADENDLLYDVVFQVGNRRYPAHIFIVASSSEYLYKLYQTAKITSHKPTITLDNIHPEPFERVLQYMYTGSCDVIELGPCGLRIMKKDLLDCIKNKSGQLYLATEALPEKSTIPEENQKRDKNYNRYMRGLSEESDRVRCCDPVRVVQIVAEMMEIKKLVKLLESHYYKDGQIYSREASDIDKTSPNWDRESFSELFDTNVCSKDGIQIPAHKCVLAARLEYFNGMFMHSWTENQKISTVTLPINYSVLLPVINFLYTDSFPEIQNSGSLDYLCTMLVVSDQLFVSRLREICEVALSKLITLKNCAELLQIADTYNAIQLKQCCMEYISLNLCTVLENRCLESIDNRLLDDITKSYCILNPIMSSRVITPFYNAPEDSIIEEFEKLFPIELDFVDEDVIKEGIEISKKKNKAKKIEYTVSERNRQRYESVSSITSLDISNDSTGDVTLSLSKIKDDKKKVDSKKEKWIEVPSQKQQKVVQARLKAISSAKDILNETPVDSFTKLIPNAMTIGSPDSSYSRMSVSPKDTPDIIRSPQGSLVISHVGPKLSQKQRKKLALQDQSPQNMTDDFGRTVVSPPEKPKNPWKIIEAATTSTPHPLTPPKTVEFNKILKAQKKQKEDSSRIMTKSLVLTQLEDKAIEQLGRFYNVHEIDDECITVRRIELQVSSPQWIHTASK